MDELQKESPLDDLAKKVFSLLKGNGLKLTIFDAGGQDTVVPGEGRRFFIPAPNIMITLNDATSESKAFVEFSKGKLFDDSAVSELQNSIRELAGNNVPPLNFSISTFGKSIQPKDFSYRAKMNKENAMNEDIKADTNSHLMGQIMHFMTKTNSPVTAGGLVHQFKGSNLQSIQHALNKLWKSGQEEGKNKINKIETNNPMMPMYKLNIVVENKSDDALVESFSKMFGSLKTSQQTLENVRILVRHKVPVDENIRGARSRHISAIFLECNGERFRFQHNYLAGARAMAQHMSHGGTMSDKVGQYISENTSNLLKLQSFNRYVTTNKLINEDSSGIIDTIKENIETIRAELKKLTGSKTYETAKARLETFEREALSEDDTTQLKDLFTIRKFDEKFEEVLPIVKQLVQEKDTYHKRIEEAAGNAVFLRRESLSPTPMFEFASENARLGFRLNEFALRITENDELSSFVNKIGTKLCKEGTVNDFERAVLKQVLENAKVEEAKPNSAKELKESVDLSIFFDRFTLNF
jgi:hypothetical protein